MKKERNRERKHLTGGAEELLLVSLEEVIWTVPLANLLLKCKVKGFDRKEDVKSFYKARNLQSFDGKRKVQSFCRKYGQWILRGREAQRIF